MAGLRMVIRLVQYQAGEGGLKSSVVGNAPKAKPQLIDKSTTDKRFGVIVTFLSLCEDSDLVIEKGPRWWQSSHTWLVSWCKNYSAGKNTCKLEIWGYGEGTEAGGDILVKWFHKVATELFQFQLSRAGIADVTKGCRCEALSVLRIQLKYAFRGSWILPSKNTKKS